MGFFRFVDLNDLKKLTVYYAVHGCAKPPHQKSHTSFLFVFGQQKNLVMLRGTYPWLFTQNQVGPRSAVCKASTFALY